MFKNSSITSVIQPRVRVEFNVSPRVLTLSQYGNGVLFNETSLYLVCYYIVLKKTERERELSARGVARLSAGDSRLLQ